LRTTCITCKTCEHCKHLNNPQTIDDVVPGTGDIDKKLKAVEDKVTEFEGKLDTGVDKEVKAYLKEMVDGMREQIRIVGEESTDVE
jgi:hypothetical protein